MLKHSQRKDETIKSKYNFKITNEINSQKWLSINFVFATY